MTTLPDRLGDLLRKIDLVGADHLELAGWREVDDPKEGLKETACALQRADFVTLGFMGQRLERDIDPDVGLYLLLGAMARARLAGVITYASGVTISSLPDGSFPTSPPAYWRNVPPFWSEMQSWIALTSSAHGQIEIHRRIAHRAAQKNTPKETP